MTWDQFYLAAFGIGFLAIAVKSLLSGRVVGKFGESISRLSQPILYWVTTSTWAALGTISICAFVKLWRTV